MTIAERLKAFMAKYDLSREQMASVIRTAPTTLDDWLSLTKPRIPPACMALVMDVLEQCPDARRVAGMADSKPAAPRGRPFRKGNPWRFKRGSATNAR